MRLAKAWVDCFLVYWILSGKFLRHYDSSYFFSTREFVITRFTEVYRPDSMVWTSFRFSSREYDRTPPRREHQTKRLRKWNFPGEWYIRKLLANDFYELLNTFEFFFPLHTETERSGKKRPHCLRSECSEKSLNRTLHEFTWQGDPRALPWAVRCIRETSKSILTFFKNRYRLCLLID